MKKLLGDYIATFAGTGFGRGLSFVTTLLLARIMGAAGFGVFSLFFTVMMLIWQLPFFMDEIYVRYVKAEAQDDQKEYMRIAFLVKLGVLFVLLAGAYPLGRFLAVHAFHKPQMGIYLCVALASGAFLSVFTTLASVYQAQERFHLYSVLNVVFYLCVFLVILTLYLLRVHLTPMTAVSVYGITTFVLGVCGIVYLYRQVHPAFPVNIPYLYKMGHFGKWLMAETVLAIIWQRLDILFLARLIDYEELGLYSAAVRIGMIATILTSSATAVFMPRGCRALRSSGSLKEYFKESALIILFLTALIVVLVSGAHWMVSRLLGEEYLGCVLAARILLLDAFFLLLYTPFSFLFFAAADTKKIFLFTLIRLGITALCLFVLVPRFGSVGAALSITSSSCMVFFVAVYASRSILAQPHRYAACEQAG